MKWHLIELVWGCLSLLDFIWSFQLTGLTIQGGWCCLKYIIYLLVHCVNFYLFYLWHLKKGCLEVKTWFTLSHSRILFPDYKVCVVELHAYKLINLLEEVCYSFHVFGRRRCRLQLIDNMFVFLLWHLEKYLRIETAEMKTSFNFVSSHGCWAV